MAKPDLGALTDLSREAHDPSFTPASNPVLGGVDPLGLRQVNFDMMDQVLPGINNVGRHVRPYVVTTWACRRVAKLAAQVGLAEVDARDFVDRVEVLYAWSQFLKRSDADLPGRQALGHIVGASEYTFGGEPWRRLRENRRYSTAFTAPITYGPALKNLGWVGPHREHADVLIALPEVNRALDAFEEAIGKYLGHPAFCELGSVTVNRDDVRSWADAWDLYDPTPAERAVAADLTFGGSARQERRAGAALMLAATAQVGRSDVTTIRGVMSGAPSNFSPDDDLFETMVAWRRLQVRQLFRLGLETCFYWLGQQLQNGPTSSDELVDAFLKEVGGAAVPNASEWLAQNSRGGVGPTDLIVSLQNGLSADDPAVLPALIAQALAFALAEAPSVGQAFERPDRLPLYRARHEAELYARQAPRAFVKHVIENWILAQHVYWSVGRGLADARARGKQILRLKVVLEEGGWTLAPGTYPPVAPLPTPDRLQTALTLASECGLLPDRALQ